MVSLEIVEAKIEEYLKDKRDLTRSALDDLYKLFIVRDHLQDASMTVLSAALNGDWINTWSSKLENADGSKGAHWTKEQTNSVMRSYGYDCDEDEFNMAMNMMFSDYCEVANNLGNDMVQFCASMAKAFLDDKDAKDDKLHSYYKCIVK